MTWVTKAAGVRVWTGDGFPEPPEVELIGFGYRPTTAMHDDCGSDAGYQRHRKRGEDPCEACRLARRGKQRAEYARRGRADRRKS